MRKINLFILTMYLAIIGVNAMTQGAEKDFPFLLGAAKGAQNEIVPLMNYTVGQNSGTVLLDGKVHNYPLSETFARFETRPDSEHPDGIAYIWVYEDANNVYFVCDWTSDNTYDNGEDYFTVYLKDGAGLKTYTQHSDGGKYGIALFDYTNIVDFQHMYYIIAVPKANLSGKNLKLGFELYGTASISGSYDWAETPTDIAVTNENVEFKMRYTMTYIIEMYANQIALLLVYNDDSELLDLMYNYSISNGVLRKWDASISDYVSYDKDKILDYKFYYTGTAYSEPSIGDVTLNPSFSETGTYKIAVVMYYLNSFTGLTELSEITSATHYGNVLTAELTVYTANAAAAPTNFQVNPVGELLRCNLSWTNPSKTYNGNPLTNITKMVLQRNGVSIKEFENATVGSNMSFVDNTIPTAYNYDYKLYAVTSEGDGVFASVKNVTIGKLCNYTFIINDSFGDGWNGSSISIIVDSTAFGNITLPKGKLDTVVKSLPNGEIKFFWNRGSSWDDEISFRIIAPDETEISNVPDASVLPNDLFLTHQNDCIAEIPTYIITASAGNGGVILPSGAITVKDSEDTTFTFTANSNYKIYQVLVDNVNQPEAVTAGKYTFTCITAPHTIVVNFKEKTSIMEITNHEIEVYPNPTTGELKIKNYELKIDNVEIFDIMGKSVGGENFRPLQNAEIVINISLFPSGIYFVKIQTESGEIVKKVIKE